VDYNSINRLADKQLVERVLQGDRHAFGVIIKNTERLVGQIVGRMIDLPEDRKDIIQDVYLKAFKYLSGFRHAARLSTWIGNIAFNTCINFLEKRKLRLVGIEMDDNSPIEGNQTEDIIAGKQVAIIMAEKLEQLPPVYKTLIVLFHQEELSYADIGQITSLPEGTIKSYLFRARKQLKESVLAEYKKDEL
jgi:RNA polymerase sigma factor (sigma-70 family)